MKNLLHGAAVLTLLISISGCRTSKQDYLAKGSKLFDSGKYAEAAINYRKAIQKDQQYGEAYYRLGLTELKEQQPRDAFEALYRAEQLEPNNTDVKELLGGLSLQYYFADPRKPQILYNLVTRISAELLAQNPKSFEGLREKAYLAMTDGKHEDSSALFRKALGIHPADAIVTTALVRNLIEAGHATEAEALALKLIGQQKDYGPAYDVLYQLYLKDNRPADAENILKNKVGNNPKQAAYLVELAAHYDRARKPADAEATLERLLANPKDFPQARMWVGDYHLRSRNFAAAVRYFEEGARASTGAEKIQYQKRAADALLGEGKGVEASATVDQIVEENPKDNDARRVQANLLLKSGSADKIAAAEREFQNLSKEKPDDASVWLGLGRAQALKGDLKQARTEYLEALKKDKSSVDARYALAEIALIEGHPQETLAQTAEILKLRPEAPRARLLEAQAFVRNGNPASARNELTRLAQDFPKSTQPRVELGLLALAEKKYPEAEQIFLKLRDTGDPRAAAGLARTYASQREFDKALVVLEDGLKKSNNSALLLSQLAGTQTLAGKYDAAIATFQKLIDLAPGLVEARLGLAEAYALKGDDNRARTTYREAAKVAPGDLRAGVEFARSLDQAGQTAEARAQYEAVLKAHPDDAIALNGAAYFIAENGGNLEEALGYAQRALKKVPEAPSFSDTIGCIYLKKGLRDSALQVFGNLVKKYPNHSTFRYHLGMALIEKGDRQNAKRELETALAEHPSVQDEARIKQLLGKIS